MTETRISIIIPTYNESDYLPKLLENIMAANTNGIATEIIISDGQSTDDTCLKSEKFPVRIINSQKGRAIQMNTGAKMASGNILYFLHADTFPPENFTAQIEQAVNKDSQAGCFRLCFDWNHWFLTLHAWFTQFNLNAFRFGDQSLFITRKLFDEIGGFREDHLMMEDQEIIHRICKQTKFKVLPDYVTTSARKYRINGVIRMQAIFYYIYFMFYLGSSQERLAGIYNRFIRM